MGKKKALITGVTGQDGSYLAELLLSNGYEVYGMSRRTANDNKQRISHILDDENFEIVYGDMIDPSSLVSLIDHVEPDEVYNLAAQSFVGESWNQPIATTQITGVGVLNILEAIRQVNKDIKFYQAGSSEMYGGLYGNTHLSETCKFHPRSPYGAAKVFGHNIAVNYRESYDMFICNGILFNHETLMSNMPLIIKKESGEINILPIGDIATLELGVEFDLEKKEYQEGKPSCNIEVWDQNGWTKIKWVSGYPHLGDKNPKIINARNFVYQATSSHVCIMEDNKEIETGDIKPGDKVKNIQYPNIDEKIPTDVSLEEAEFFGMLVGDGNLKRNTPRFTNKDRKLKERFCFLWGIIADNTDCKYKKSYSGFDGTEVGQVDCLGSYKREFDIYTQDESVFGYKNKKVPSFILNSTPDVMESFLVGYNACDGMKKNKCKYRFKNFKTNSATLASGLLFLVSKVTGQKYNITVEESWAHGKQEFYYSINLLSDLSDNIERYNKVKKMIDQKKSQRQISRDTGVSRSFIRKIQNGYVPDNTHHLELPNNEVKKTIGVTNYDGWFFDLETESGTFHAGVGQGVVHNSPRRGIEFVTRKITDGVAKIACGLQDHISLGNLDAKRDWGHAKDYVYAMYLMMQMNKPDDYVVATGEAYSVRDFVIESFSAIGISDWEEYVKQDPRFMRPAEVDTLLGEPSKARLVLGWKSSYNFSELVKDMVSHDMERICHEKGALV